MRTPASAVNSLTASLFRANNVVQRIKTQANWCIHCGVAHGDSLCLRTSGTPAGTSSNMSGMESPAGLFFSMLPPEIRLDIYDQICATAQRDEACHGFIKQSSSVDSEVSLRHDRILVEADRLDAIVRWIKGPYNQAFRSLILVNKKFKVEVREYIRKVNVARMRGSHVEMIWFEDLGHLLTNLGPVGRENLTNIVLTWDNLIRDSINGTKQLGPAMWRDEDGPARIFGMLAACKNLINITVRFDTYRLMHMKPDGTQRSSPYTRPADIPGMRELRDVKGSGTIKIEYSNRTGVNVGAWTSEFQAWIVDGMKLSNNESHNWEYAMKFAAAEDKRVKKKIRLTGEDVE
jgi:hypothetical protein